MHRLSETIDLESDARFILIVDDNSVNLSVLASLLEHENYPYRVAINGTGALRAIEDELPALILLDIQMPGMDGFAICDHLKSHPSTASIPIIFMTAASDIESKAKGFALGAVDYVTKPFQEVELLARIKTHLQLHALTQNLEKRVSERTTELRASEARQRKLFELSPIGLSLCRMDGSLVDVNPAYAAILGRTVPETLSLKSWDITPLTYAKEEASLLESLKQTGRYGPYEKEYIHKNGHLVPVRLSGILIEWDGENLIWSSVEDISDRKAAEQQLHRVNSELTQTNQQLIHATKLKDEFFANMSHELRTPLNSVIGFSQLLRHDSYLSDDQRNTINIINRNGEHLLTLINNVLEISKIESGHAELNLGEVNLCQILEELEGIVRGKADLKQLQLSFQLADEVSRYLQVDRLKLKQVLLNLLDNAIKFTDKGEVILNIEVVQLDQDSTGHQQAIQFSVTDTGSGIPPENQSGIFNPFIQSIEKGSFNQGTGLGLSICQNFVHMMGGKIHLESDLGQGSRFQFTLLLEVPANQAKETPQARKDCYQAKRMLRESSCNYRLLVVDDNQDNRALLSKMLTLPGFEVEIAVNGEAAIEKNQLWQPHLIWMDLRMPTMDGLETVRQIRQAGHQPRIIALSAQAFATDRAQALAVGCDDFLSKPFSAEDLFEKLEQWLKVEFITESSQLTSNTIQSEDAFQSGTKSTEVTITEGYQSMPVDWQTALTQSIRSLNKQAVTDLLAQVPPEHRAMADAIAHLQQNYRYDVLMDILVINY